MAVSIAKTFKDISPSDISVRTTQLSQLVDIVQEDISGSATRKQYAVFVTASSDVTTTYSVTSSLFQTTYDQDYTLQVANGLFDTTVGLYWSGSTVLSSSSGVNSSGKYLFPTSSLMMREKVDLYKLFAGKLLGDTDSAFYAPYSDASVSNRIEEAMFISFKRLFTRDSIKRNTFAMRFYASGAFSGGPESVTVSNGYTGSNLYITSPSGSSIFTDSTEVSNYFDAPGGKVGSIVDAANTSKSVGLIWYDAGVAVLDLKRICYADQHISGVIRAVTGSIAPSLVNQTIIGSSTRAFGSILFNAAIPNTDNGKGFQLIDSNGKYAQVTINSSAADGVISSVTGDGSSGTPWSVTIGVTSATVAAATFVTYFVNALSVLQSSGFKVYGAASSATINLYQIVAGAAGNTTITTVGGALATPATITSFSGGFVLPGSNPNAKLIPDLMVSASIDDLVNYFATTRFSSGSLTGITFQNQTAVNSTLFFCRAGADEFNYSNNPTYFETDGSLVVMNAQAGAASPRPFTYPTTIGLYDEQDRLLAVAKFSRPIEKNDEKDLTIRVRLDF